MTLGVTKLVELLEDGRHRCHVCQWYCELRNEEPGRCLMREGTEDGIAVLNHAIVSAAQVAAGAMHSPAISNMASMHVSPMIRRNSAS